MKYAELTILYAPENEKHRCKKLKNKLKNLKNNFGLNNEKIIVNPLNLKSMLSKLPQQSTIIIAWGLHAKPNWNNFIDKSMFFENIRQLFLIDLYERKNYKGETFDIPRINAGHFLSKKILKTKFQHFVDGYFVKNEKPYGMKRVKKTLKNNHRKHKCYKIEIGDREEVEIVKYIFYQFVVQGRKRAEICHLLNAQKIKPPRENKIWNNYVIKSILKNPIYIGASEYKGMIQYDVYPLIIDKAIFYEAQAMIEWEASFNKPDIKKISERIS